MYWHEEGFRSVTGLTHPAVNPAAPCCCAPGHPAFKKDANESPQLTQSSQTWGIWGGGRVHRYQVHVKVECLERKG
jgi:hypothetical protein